MYEQIKKDITQNYYQSKYANDGQRFVKLFLLSSLMQFA